METKDTLTKKNLKQRLAAVMTIYMEGLSPKKQEKLEKYLDNRLNNMVDFYFDHLKKKKRQVLVLKPLPHEIMKPEEVMQDKTMQN